MEHIITPNLINQKSTIVVFILILPYVRDSWNKYCGVLDVEMVRISRMVKYYFIITVALLLNKYFRFTYLIRSQLKNERYDVLPIH